MKFYTFRYCVGPTYRKVFVTVIKAKDSYQAFRLLLKKVGRGKKIQSLGVTVSE